MPSAGPPEVAPTGRLELASEAATPKEDGPFAVVFAGPRGEVAGSDAISVVFNRPVRKATLAGEEEAVPFVLTPNVPGTFRPIGTNAFSFVPDAGRLPAATEYRVKIPGTFRALDGSTLGADYTFDFSTPRPRLVRSTPWDGETGLVPSTRFELDFNQPLDRARVERSLTLTLVDGKNRRDLPFTVRVPDPKNEKHFVLEPGRPLPPEHRVELRIGAGLVGKSGPLPAGEDRVVSFETYGRLRVEGVNCSRDSDKDPCYPRGGFWLQLSNAVKFRDLKRAISIEPPVALHFESWQSEDETTSYLDLNGRFLPGQTYVVRVDGNLSDVHGQKLGKTAGFRLPVGNHDPDVVLGISGDYFEPNQSKKIPIASVNVPEYRLLARSLSVDEVRGLVEHENQSIAVERLVERFRGQAEIVRPSADVNTPAEHDIDPRSILAKSGGRGALFVAVDFSRKGQKEERHHLVQVTDLAISAKLSRGEASVVWVTSLSTGAPVSGAEVLVASPGHTSQKFLTDRDGIARLPAGAVDAAAERADRSLVIVRKDADWAHRRVGDYVSPWRSRVSTDLFGRPQKLGLLFTDRGIYRPGDEVQLKGILRREANAGNDMLARQKFTLELRSPDWEVMETLPVETSAYGTFDRTIRIPATAALGQYRFEVKELGAEGGAATYFSVAEYRPVEMQARVESDRPSYVQGENARFDVFGDYLFGAPMGGADVTYRATRSETSWTVPGLDGFVTDASTYDSAHPEKAPSAGLLVSGEAKLDSRGKASHTIPLTLPGQRSPELVGFDAEVRDVSRQTVASSSSAIVHPADVYVALRPLDPYFTTTPGKVAPEVLVTSPSGAIVSGQSVKLEAVRRTWAVVRETSGEYADSALHPLDETVSQCTLKSATKPARCELALRDPGYYVVLATTKDEKGRTARAAIDTYALGAGESHWPDDDALTVELVPDKKQYARGDVARVLVKSPFQTADALVTIEGNGVRSERRTRLEGATPTLSIPITEDMRPNAYVSVHLIRPRTNPAKKSGAVDVGAPTYRTGHAELRVDPETRRLRVALRPNKTDFGPGEAIDVSLAVKDASGRGAASEVTVYAVDEGVLALVGYRTPDPLPVFTASRPLRVATLESRDALASVRTDLGHLLGLGPQKGAEGGGGGEDVGSARRDFRQSAYFNPAVLTAADGTARVNFRLPESLTTYRLMAVATTRDDRYGFAETRVTTSRKLMARPALPRVLRAGDAAELGVVVSAKAFGPARVEVRLEATGVELERPANRTIELPREGSVEVRFPVRATRVGEAKLRFSVSGSSGTATARDVVELTRRVLAPGVLETVALYGQTRKASAEEIGSLAGIRRDVGGLEVQTASTALVGVDAGMESLLDYPYGCTEQLSSRLLPLLSLEELARDFRVSLPKNPRASVETTLQEIVRRQRGDGGFGMWPESSESSLWVTPYVLFTLAEAKSRGYAIPQATLDQGVEFMRRQLAREGPRHERAALAFAVDVLAILEKPDPGYMNSLFQARAELPAFSRALLLHAMVVSKQPAADVATLRRELENGLRIDANRAYFADNLGDAYAEYLDSPARTTALVLRALIAADPRHPLGAKLARGLLDERTHGTWRNTQETAFSLLALDAYRKAAEKEVPDFVAKIWSGTATVLEAPHRGRDANASSASIPMAKLAGGRLTFEKSGSGTLFYEARLRYAKEVLPTEPLDRGFFVQKSYRSLAPGALDHELELLPRESQSQLVAGQLVLVDLVVVAPGPRHFTVIDDPLPAGLEAIDEGLATTAAWNRIAGSVADGDSPSDDEVARGDAFFASSYRKEVRDDRVVFFVDHMAAGLYHYRYLARATTLGRFVVPPTRAEEMYTPEVFGRTPGAHVEVR